LRGGTYNNNRRNVRCAYRNNNNPNNRNNNIGFRVVSHGFLLWRFAKAAVAVPAFRSGYGLGGAAGGRCGRFPAAIVEQG